VSQDSNRSRDPLTNDSNAPDPRGSQRRADEAEPRADGSAASELRPDQPNQATIEEFEEEGLGIAAKE
jgi:hypothetical protein